MRRWPLAATATAIVALALSAGGCGHPMVPSSAVQKALPPATSHSPVSDIGPGPQLGVDLYAGTGYPLPVVRHYGQRTLRYIAKALGAQGVGLIWNLYSPSGTSDSVVPTKISLSPAAIRDLTVIAQAHHLFVQYRPLIRVDPQWDWEGIIMPPDKRAWFESLFQAELPYLRIAQRLHVNEFVVGTELSGLNANSEWPWFLAKVRSVYHGTISYAAYQNQYFNVPRDLPPLKEFGIDPYPNVNLPPSASVAQLVAGWDYYFRTVPEPLLRHTVMDEVSIAATDGAYLSPSVWSVQGVHDPQIQVRWFTAACKIARQYSMRGLYFYEVDLSDNPAHPPNFPASFFGKPGAGAIRNCLHILQQGSPRGAGRGKARATDSTLSRSSSAGAVRSRAARRR